MSKRKIQSRTVRARLKDHFIPHKGNNYHPHALHAKRAAFYAGFGMLLKAFAVGYAALLPFEAYLAPDVLQAQTNRIVTLVNDLRKEKGIRELVRVKPLDHSSQMRAADMADQGYFGHIGPNGHTLTYFLGAAGYTYSAAGENLAMGFSDADAVMGGWMKSPTHYANLVDPEFEDVGVGIEEGSFEGQNTVFIAEHFGTPFLAETTPVKAALAPTPQGGFVTSRLHDFTATTTLSAIAYDGEHSGLIWTPTSDGRTRVEAHVAVAGSPVTVQAVVGGYSVELALADNGEYVGSLTLPERPESLFKTVVGSTVMMTGADGIKRSGVIDWEHPKISSPTPWDTYVRANAWFARTFSVFSVVHGVYWALLVFFAATLAISLAVELRKQHPHVIVRTLCLIGFLAILLKF